MSEQVAREIEELRRRFGFERKEAVAYWHLRHAHQLMSEMGQTDHFEELDREGRSELEADFREFAGLIHDISVLGESRVFQHFAAPYRELGTRVLRRNYPDGWDQAYGSADEDSLGGHSAAVLVAQAETEVTERCKRSAKSAQRRWPKNWASCERISWRVRYFFLESPGHSREHLWKSRGFRSSLFFRVRRTSKKVNSVKFILPEGKAGSQGLEPTFLVIGVSWCKV